MSKIPRTTTTVTRFDGSTVDIEHVDHAAVLDQWNQLGEAVWALDVGDLHNVIDIALDRIAQWEAVAKTAVTTLTAERNRT